MADKSRFLRTELLLGPRPYQEEEIGRAWIDRRALREALVVTFADHPYTPNKANEWRESVEKAEAQLASTLSDDLASWLRAVVRWNEDACACRSPKAFLAWLERQEFDAAVLGVPAVQSQISRVRRECHGEDLRRLSRWLIGTTGFGRRQTVDKERVRVLAERARLRIDKLATLLRQVLSAREGRRQVSFEDAWMVAAAHQNRLATRLEAAGLKEKFSYPPRYWSPRTITAELIGFEERIGPQYVARLMSAPTGTKSRTKA